MCGSQPDDRTVLMIEPSPLLMALRELQPFLAPKPLHFLVIHFPSFNAQQFHHLPITVASILFGQSDQSQSQFIVISRCWSILQGAPRQTNHPARPPLRHCELLACMNDGLTKLLGGQALGFRWFRLSLRMSLSSSSSATISFSRAFSFSRLFI